MSYFAMLSKAQKQAVLKLVAKESAKNFDIYRKALVKSLDFRMPNPEQRLIHYQTRVPEIWAALQGQDPTLYSQQMQDWAKLEMRRAQFQLSPWNPFHEKSDSPANALEGQQGEL